MSCADRWFLLLSWFLGWIWPFSAAIPGTALCLSLEGSRSPCFYHFSPQAYVASAKWPWRCVTDRLRVSNIPSDLKLHLWTCLPSIFCSQSFSFLYTPAPVQKLSPTNVSAKSTDKSQASLSPFLAGLELVLTQLLSFASEYKWIKLLEPSVWKCLQWPDQHNSIYGKKGKKIQVFCGLACVKTWSDSSSELGIVCLMPPLALPLNVGARRVMSILGANKPLYLRQHYLRFCKVLASWEVSLGLQKWQYPPQFLLFMPFLKSRTLKSPSAVQWGETCTCSLEGSKGKKGHGGSFASKLSLWAVCVCQGASCVSEGGLRSSPKQQKEKWQVHIFYFLTNFHF